MFQLVLLGPLQEKPQADAGPVDKAAIIPVTVVNVGKLEKL